MKRQLTIFRLIFASLLCTPFFLSCNNNQVTPAQGPTFSVDINGTTYTSETIFATVAVNTVSSGSTTYTSKFFNIIASLPDAQTVTLTMNYDDSTSVNNCLPTITFQYDTNLGPLAGMGYSTGTQLFGSILSANIQVSACSIGSPNTISGTFSGEMEGGPNLVPHELTNGKFDNISFTVL
ncbi:MAG: hypothetical protein AAF587_08400 [Bacteroidota bacterium]